MLGIFCSSLFFSTFLLSHYLDKGSFLSHRSINTIPKLFWLAFVLFCKLLSCLSIFGAGQRFVSCCVASVILRLLVISQTRLLGFIFIAFFICLSSTTVVFSADQVVVGVAGGFQTLDFSMPFVFAIALIDFLFSFNIQIACFCLKVRSLVFILVCVHHHQMQDSEYRSNGYNWYDTFPAFNTCRMNATGHSWSFRKTRN